MNVLRSLASLALSFVAGTALAADPRAAAPATSSAVSACSETKGIPTDAFGFTTGSDVADVGSFGPSLTYVGGFGARSGHRAVHGLQAQGSYGLAPCLEVGPYLLGGLTDASLGGVSSDQRSIGGGVETKIRLLGRDLHGLGLTLVIDPSAQRVDPQGAGRFTTANTGIRLFADKAIVDDVLFAALNLSQDLTWTGPSPYQRSSTLTIGGSLAWQFADGLYLSGEVRHQRVHGSLGLDRLVGQATFAGPGLYWQATKQLAISAAYNVQLAGRAKGEQGELDLTNFSRHLVKVKLAYGF